MNEQQYERYLNIETEGYQQGFPKSMQYHRYEPTPYRALEELFQHYELPDNAVFIDVGCGKGRVPIYMHEKFSIKAKGIEMDPKFFAAAENNAMLFKEKHMMKRNGLEFFHGLAENYEIQMEDNVFFFFNPFSVHVFRKMINAILMSKEQFEREIHLIFYYPSPQYEQFLNEHVLLIYINDIKISYSRNPNERFIIYKIK